VLVGVDDVEARVGEEAADRGDQTGAVGAGEQEARCRLVGDEAMMAARRRGRKLPLCGAISDSGASGNGNFVPASASIGTRL
jgi:hypothetical protein